MQKPATVGSELVGEFNRILQAARKYVSADDLTFRRYLAQATSLLKVKPVEGHNVLALLYGVAGDCKQAMYHIDVALNLDKSSSILQCNKASILANLGYFSESQKFFELGATPEKGEFRSRWTLGMCSGSFHILKRFVSQANRMALETENVANQLIESAVLLMDELSLSDAALACALDIAGQLMRENRLFFCGEGPEVFVWDKDATEKHLSIIFKVGLTAVQALTLDEELGHRLFEAQTSLPFEVMIHFESGLPVNERFADRPAIAG